MLRVRGRARFTAAVGLGLGVSLGLGLISAPGAAVGASEITETPAGARLMGGVAGTELIGLPTTRLVGTLTNATYPCQQVSPFRGLDGQVVDVSGFTRQYVEVVPDAALDLDVSFFDARCQPIAEHIDLEGGYDDSFDFAGTGGIERGFVPPEAAFAEVAGYSGAGGFAIAIYDVALPA